MRKDLGWFEAVKAVLEKAEDAMHYTEIAEKIVEQGLKTKVGATPAASVNATIATSIKTSGLDSPFRRVGRGEYILNRKDSPTGVPTPAATEKSRSRLDLDEAGGIIQAFGMFWRSEKVVWKNSPKILGRQQIGADNVDFCGQTGVYLLHDRSQVIYVGRSVDRPLGQRLFEHTKDRLNGRWDRFSWFGLKRVNERGALEDVKFDPSTENIIAVMEAILIEGLEPPQNRKRGDSFSAIEYLQADDPDLEKGKKERWLKEIMGAVASAE